MRALFCLCVVSIGFVGCTKETSTGQPADVPVAKATKPTQDAVPVKAGASRVPPKVAPSKLAPSQDAWFWRTREDGMLGLIATFQQPKGLRVWGRHHQSADGSTQLTLAQDSKYESVKNTILFDHPSSKSNGVHWDEDQDTLYVVSYPHYMAGASVVAIDAKTLKTKWKAKTTAHRPLSIDGEVLTLSARYNMVQVRVVNGELFVYGRQGKSPYIEVLDKTTGKSIRKGSVPYALVDEFWNDNAFEQKVKQTNPKSLAAQTHGEDAMYLFDYNAIQTVVYPAKSHPTRHYQPRHVRNPVVRIRKVSATDDALWQYDYKFRGSQTRVYAVACNQTLFVAKYNQASTGVTVAALDAKTGKLRWKANPYGVGSIGHSKWSNAVVLTCAKEGHLKVWGKESSPYYMELLDFKTGKTLSNTQMIYKEPEPTCIKQTEH